MNLEKTFGETEKKLRWIEIFIFFFWKLGIEIKEKLKVSKYEFEFERFHCEKWLVS